MVESLGLTWNGISREKLRKGPPQLRTDQVSVTAGMKGQTQYIILEEFGWRWDTKQLADEAEKEGRFRQHKLDVQ